MNAQADLYQLSFTGIDGTAQPLSTFAGKVLLIVNTASACGFTPQLEGLEALQQQFAPQGFSVIGFPCNQFGGQEPGDEPSIAAFCERRYGVSFPLSAKIDVNGDQAAPVFQYLKHAAPGALGTQAIKWNFTKFLVDRHGQVVKRYAPMTKPTEIVDDIMALLH